MLLFLFGFAGLVGAFSLFVWLVSRFGAGLHGIDERLVPPFLGLVGGAFAGLFLGLPAMMIWGGSTEVYITAVVVVSIATFLVVTAAVLYESRPPKFVTKTLTTSSGEITYRDDAAGRIQVLTGRLAGSSFKDLSSLRRAAG